MSSFDGQSSALAEGGEDPCVVLMRFDLSSIPATAVVNGAELHTSTDDDAGAPVMVYRVLQAWDEETATWLLRSQIRTWSGAGASPPSREVSAIGTLSPRESFTEYTVPLDPVTVQSWVTAPTSNYGFVIVSTNNDGARFATREADTRSMRPFLRVTHAP